MDGRVLLVDGHNLKEGRVLVCYIGEWHSICSDTWSELDVEADVVCSTLGYFAQLGMYCFNICCARESTFSSYCSFCHSQFWS